MDFHFAGSLLPHKDNRGPHNFMLRSSLARSGKKPLVSQRNPLHLVSRTLSWGSNDTLTQLRIMVQILLICACR